MSKIVSFAGQTLLILMYFFIFIACALIMKASRSSGASCLWETLGKPRYIAAPMVDHSSLPWRVFLHQQGNTWRIFLWLLCAAFHLPKQLWYDGAVLSECLFSRMQLRVLLIDVLLLLILFPCFHRSPSHESFYSPFFPYFYIRRTSVLQPDGKR